MKRNKICENCKKVFFIPPNVSSANWAIRRFCTIKCKCLASRGIPSWNAGKCPPFKITPAYREKMRNLAISKGYGKWMKGKKLSPQTIEKMKLQKGENHASWKGGRHIGSDGYMMIYSPNHPNKDNHNHVREHRLVAEKILGRYLDPKEVIHHISENKLDNRPENLYLFPTDRQHRSHHRLKIKQVLVSNL